MKRRVQAYVIIAAVIAGLFGYSRKERPYKCAEVYNDLRNQVLTLDPNMIQPEPDEVDRKVWGIMMETGYPEAVASLVAMGDGTASLYFSNGGGLVGAGAHEPTRVVVHELLELAQDFPEKLTVTDRYPLPRHGYTRFYLLTHGGVLTAEIKEDVLANEQHELSPLFYKVHDVVAQVCMAAEEARVQSYVSTP